MSPVFQVVGPDDIDEIFEFASALAIEATPNELDRTFMSWSAGWRRESLEHYLRLGWSFIARIDGRVSGFYLAQPFLFVRGHAQTLWVEHVAAKDEATRQALCEVAVKVAREKHLQRVLFYSSRGEAVSLRSVLNQWSPQALGDEVFEIKTVK